MNTTVSRRGWALLQVAAIPLLLIFWLFLNLKYLPVWTQVAELLNVPLSFSSELSIDLALWLMGRLGVVLLLAVLWPWALTMRRLGQTPPWLLFVNSMVMVVLGWMLLMVHLFAMEVGDMWLEACPTMSHLLTVSPALLYQSPDIAPFQAMTVAVKPTAVILKVGQTAPLSLQIDDPGRVLLVVFPASTRAYVAGSAPSLVPDSVVRLEPDQPIAPTGLQVTAGPQHPVEIRFSLLATRPGHYVLALGLPVQVPSGLTMLMSDLIDVTAR